MAKREYPASTKRKPYPPVHPGSILREDVLPALRIPVSRAADELGVSRQTLHRILAEQAPVTPDMAVRLGKFCGNGPELWLRLQAAYDLWHAEERLAREIKRIPTRSVAA
jgi:addiction module HigA family antidote